MICAFGVCPMLKPPPPLPPLCAAVARAYEVLSDKDMRAAYDDGVDVDDSKWQQSEWQRRENEKARNNVRFQGGAGGGFRRRP